MATKVCDYKTSKKYNFDIHKTTRKHRLSHNRTQISRNEKPARVNLCRLW